MASQPGAARVPPSHPPLTPSYISYQQFCLRICISASEQWDAALMCQHTLDEMGCEWVMPGDYTNGTFTECEADAALPPGIYPNANGTGYSTFAQRYTGTYTDTAHRTVGLFTVGQTVRGGRAGVGDQVGPRGRPQRAARQNKDHRSFPRSPPSVRRARPRRPTA